MGLFDTKASLEVEKGGPIPFLFNPSELSMSLAAKWDSESDDEEPQFKGMETETLSFTLLLDTTQNPGKAVTTPADKPQPVTKWTSRLIGLVRPDAVAGTNKNTNDERPPWVRFQWGDFVSFKAVVTSLDITFKLFSPSGVPLRAECAITLTKFEDDKSWPKQNPTSGTPAPERSHLLQPGETLDRVAAVELADPTAWRAIAQANGIRDPFTLRPGVQVSVPRRGA
jgi:hypothetical protein